MGDGVNKKVPSQGETYLFLEQSLAMSKQITFGYCFAGSRGTTPPPSRKSPTLDQGTQVSVSEPPPSLPDTSKPPPNHQSAQQEPHHQQEIRRRPQQNQQPREQRESREPREQRERYQERNQERYQERNQERYQEQYRQPRDRPESGSYSRGRGNNRGRQTLECLFFFFFSSPEPKAHKVSL